MLEIGTLVVLVGTLVFAAHFFSWLFSFTKVPDTLLLIFVGIILGPITGLITPDYFGKSGELTVIAILIILLFQSGLDLRFSVVRHAWRGTIGLSIISLFVSMFIVGIVLYSLFGFNLWLALTVGSIMGGTSSAVVIPLLKQIKIGEEPRTILMLESVFSDVLVVIATIALLGAYTLGRFSFFEFTSNVIVSFLGATILGVLTALVWARLLTTVRHMKNSIFTTPALVLLLFGFSEMLGFNGLISALSFGVFMGNVQQLNTWLDKKHPFLRYVLWSSVPSKREKLFFAEAVFLLQTFFFVYVGISLSINTWQPAIIGLALVVLLVIGRAVTVRFVVNKNVTISDATLMSVIVPRGLAAAALATLPVQAGVPDGALIQEIVYSVIFFSVFISSILIFAVYKTDTKKVYGAYLSKFNNSDTQ